MATGQDAPVLSSQRQVPHDTAHIAIFLLLLPHCLYLRCSIKVLLSAQKLSSLEVVGESGSAHWCKVGLLKLKTEAC